MMNTSLTTFDTMTSDLRGDRGWGLIKNFIVEPHRATTRAGLQNTSASSNKITAYCIGKWTDGTWNIFGWGEDGSNTGAWYKYDISTNSWTTPATFAGNVGSRNNDIVFHFEGKFYGYGAAKLSKWTPASAFDPNWQTSGSSWTYIAQPVIVGANAYFAMDNIVYELATGASSLSTKYTLSTDRGITSLSPVGSSLSVMTYHEGEQKSREFLFAVAGSDTNAYESIDWGAGKVKHHKEIKGLVVAVIDERTNQAGDPNEASIKLKRRSGNQIITDAEIKLSLTATAIGASCQIFEDKLCFKVDYTTSQEQAVSGIMSYSASGVWNIELTNEFDSNDNTQNSFLPYNNSWFIAHSSASSNVYTAVTSPFSYTGSLTYYDGILQTRLIDHGDRAISKALVGASVSFEPLDDSVGVDQVWVKLYYKRPEDADWTILKTVTTDGSTRLSFSNLKGTVPHYKEIQFQVKARNATITGFKETSAIVKDEPYDTR